MRVVTTLALTVWAVMLSGCERRNYDLCSNEPPYNTCEAGKFCSIPPGETIGQCIANECSPGKNVCPSERPICGSDGRCTTCTGNSQCAAIDPSLPFCMASRCVACAASTDCKDAAKPVCDSATNTCRTCALHSECDYKAGVAGDGVCAKDDTLAAIARPIPLGSCVDSSRILYADDVNTVATRITQLSADLAYIKIRRQTTNTRLDLPGKLSGLPDVHIIGPMADQAPSSWSSLPPIDLGNPAGDALRLLPGGTTTLEGLLIRNSQTGLFCDSKGTNPVNVQTKVRVLRSIIGGSAVGIRSLPKCEILVDQSWVGKGPDPALGSVAGNDQAMNLDSTKLDLVNSVIFHNYKNTMTSGLFFSDSAGLQTPSRILHTTFSAQDYPNNRGVLAIDCGYMPGNSLTLVNSLFLNSMAPGINVYVNQTCKGSGFAYLGSNSSEVALAGANNVTNAPPSALLNINAGQLAYAGNAPTELTRGGTNSFSDTQGPVPMPAVDINGAPRNKDKPSLGAFEAK